LFIALYLTLYKLGMIGTLSCSIGSCETVNTSRWARFLGAPVAGWGVLFYLATLVIAIAGIQPSALENPAISRLLVGWTGIGVLFSAWLTYLELFTIHAICIWCVTSAVIVLVIFCLSVLDLRDPASGNVTSS
jgi:Predicted membrane protein